MWHLIVQLTRPGRRSKEPRRSRSRRTTANAARQRLSTSQAASRDPGTEGLALPGGRIIAVRPDNVVLSC